MTAQAARSPFLNPVDYSARLGGFLARAGQVPKSRTEISPCAFHPHPPENAASSQTLSYFGTGSQAGVARIFLLGAFMPRTMLRCSRKASSDELSPNLIKSSGMSEAPRIPETPDAVLTA
jgi:hypothetical protein